MKGYCLMHEWDMSERGPCLPCAEKRGAKIIQVLKSGGDFPPQFYQINEGVEWVYS